MGQDRSGSRRSTTACKLFRLGVDTHVITSHFALPLLIKSPGGLVIEMTDGTDEYNATNYRVSFFYDLAKAAVSRMAFALAHELKPHGRDRDPAHAGLAPLGGDARRLRRHRGELARRHREDPALRDLREPVVRRPRGGRAGGRPRRVALDHGKSLSSGELAKVYGFTDLDGSQPDAWRYIVEVESQGKPADTTGYR